MKKLLILLGGLVAICVILATAGPLIGLGFALTFVFLGMHYYVKSKSVISKVLWVFIGFIGLTMAVSNIPALCGLAAIIVLYVLYKSWKNEEVSINVLKEEDDPFINFENEWSKITK